MTAATTDDDGGNGSGDCGDGAGDDGGTATATAAMAKAAAEATATDEAAPSKKSFLSACRENTLIIRNEFITFRGMVALLAGGVEKTQGGRYTSLLGATIPWRMTARKMSTVSLVMTVVASAIQRVPPP